MKKILVVSVLFIAAIMMVAGCDDKKKNDNNKNLMLLMLLSQNSLPPTQATGDPQDVTDASSATFATASAMSQVTMAGNPGTGMMQSLFVNTENPTVKEGLKESILAAVNADAVDKMNAVYTSCSGKETVNKDLTAAITGTGYSITPNVHVSGEFTCNRSTATAGSFSAGIKISGTVTATFTNMHVQVFDIENYLNTSPHAITFKDVVVNGTVSISDVNVTASVAFGYSLVPLPSLELNVSNVSGLNIASTDMQIDGNAAPFDLDVAEKFTFNLNLLGMSGSVSAIVSGTVGQDSVSFSYGFSGDSIFKFSDYIKGQIGYQPSW